MQDSTYYLPLNFVWNQFWQNLNLKNCHFYNFRVSQVATLNFGKFGTWKNRSKLLTSELRTSKIAKNDNFDHLKFTKIWFHVKSEHQTNSNFLDCTAQLHILKVSGAKCTVADFFREINYVYTFNLLFRLTIKAKCPMMLRSFPMDWQSCPLVIGSCKY